MNLVSKNTEVLYVNFNQVNPILRTGLHIRTARDTADSIPKSKFICIDRLLLALSCQFLVFMEFDAETHSCMRCA